MTPAEAKQIIEVLAGGVDPSTGEVLPDDGPLSSPHVIRALFVAAKALEVMAASKPARPAAAAPGNAGKSWTEEEDQRLVGAFDAGTPVAELARTHERTTGAISSRLIRLGRLQVSRDGPPAYRDAAGLPCGASLQSRLAPHSKSVLKPERVKAKPPSRRGQSRGLDPITT